MLHLSRKCGESIVINGTIKVTVQAVSGKTVRLAIDHPAGTTVLREELYLKITQQNQDAALSDQLFLDFDTLKKQENTG